MRTPRWLDWESQVTPRSVRLLIIAALLGIGAAANVRPPEVRSTHQHAIASTAFDRARADSIKQLIAIPAFDPVVARMQRSYRRSTQIERAILELRDRNLEIPITGLFPGDLHDSFNDLRDDGARVHRALDIPAPRGTPVISVDDGRVLKLHTSPDGGISVYATDPEQQFIYFYAHLHGYHPSIQEGAPLMRGDTIGFVGTTGNSPPDVPHLHFAILRTSNVVRWSRGSPVNPVLVFR